MSGGVPDTHYALNGDLNIAYQVIPGEVEGPARLLLSDPRFCIDLMWDDPLFARNLRRLSTAGRLITLDPHGCGSSDQPSEPFPSLQIWMDDIGAVLDATATDSATLIALGEMSRPALLFAAAHPERVDALVLINASPRSRRADDYPAGMPDARMDAERELYISSLGQGQITDWLAPSRASDPVFRRLSLKGERLSTRRGNLRAYLDAFLEGDVRSVLSSISAEVLLIHRVGNPHLRIDHARYLRDHLPRARLIELPGNDHLWHSGDVDGLFDEVVGYLSGSAPARRTSDRMLATVLFTDIVDSTAHAARVGDSAWRNTLETYYGLVTRHVASSSGRLVKSTGDGSLAVFDGPARAIRCACGIRDDVQELGLSIRAGLHTGEIELIGDDIGGIAVHVGARVSALARPGQVLVSASVPPLVIGSGIDFEAQGSHELKGVPGEWAVFEARV